MSVTNESAWMKHRHMFQLSNPQTDALPEASLYTINGTLMTLLQARRALTVEIYQCMEGSYIYTMFLDLERLLLSTQ